MARKIPASRSASSFSEQPGWDVLLDFHQPISQSDADLYEQRESDCAERFWLDQMLCGKTSKSKLPRS